MPQVWATQVSVTAGTLFHRTRTELPKWFLAAYLMGKDKRGVSAKFLHRARCRISNRMDDRAQSSAMASVRMRPADRRFSGSR